MDMGEQRAMGEIYVRKYFQHFPSIAQNLPLSTLHHQNPVIPLGSLH